MSECLDATPRRKHLSPRQRDWLAAIPMPPGAVAETTLIGFDLRKGASLVSAVLAHNAGRTTNSPLPTTARIARGSVDPTNNAYGYWLEIDALTAEAVQAHRLTRTPRKQAPTMSTRRKRLTKIQRRMLAHITPDGTPTETLAAIGGLPHARALRALVAAVQTHNGARPGGGPINSPLPASISIEHGEVITPAGKVVFGYRLLISDPLVEEAFRARQAKRTYDATHGTETP